MNDHLVNDNSDESEEFGIDTRNNRKVMILPNYWSGRVRIRVREIRENGNLGPIYVINSKYIVPIN